MVPFLIKIVNDETLRHIITILEKILSNVCIFQICDVPISKTQSYSQQPRYEMRK